MSYEKYMNSALFAAIEAGKEILDVYTNNENFEVEIKDDNSPLTMADKRANDRIEEILGSELPILSEEGKEIRYEERKDWDLFWIVDPLDGTKEFIKRNGEFTVNIALIKGNRPVGGVIYLPVKETLYFALDGIGSYKVSEVIEVSGGSGLIDEMKLQGARLPVDIPHKKYTVVASRSHLSAETQAFIDERKKQYPDLQTVSSGSSIKICLVAEGVADVYPRYAPTMEWDTAAGDAIVTFAGKKLIDHETGEPMLYNRKDLLNNWFLVE